MTTAPTTPRRYEGKCGQSSMPATLKPHFCDLEFGHRGAHQDDSGMSWSRQGTDPYAPLFGSPVAPWHRWFAWRPVDTADRGIRWMTLIHRRRIQKYHCLPGGRDFWFQYAVSIQAKDTQR